MGQHGFRLWFCAVRQGVITWVLVDQDVSIERQLPTMSDLYVLYLGMESIPTIPDSQCELSCNVPLSARKRSSHVYRVRYRRLPWVIGLPSTIGSAKPYVTISSFGQTQERPVESNLAEVQVSMTAYVTEINVINLSNLKEGQYWLNIGLVPPGSKTLYDLVLMQCSVLKIMFLIRIFLSCTIENRLLLMSSVSKLSTFNYYLICTKT